MTEAGASDMLPVPPDTDIDADMGAARPFRRAAGFLVLALVLLAIAFVLPRLLKASSGEMLWALAATPALALAVIAAIHVLAGVMLLTAPRGGR